MATYYKATTAAGETFTRCTENRTYTHAVVRFGKSGAAWEPTWAGRLDLAEKAARPGKWNSGQGTILDAVEITGKEYRALRKVRQAAVRKAKEAATRQLIEDRRVAEEKDNDNDGRGRPRTPPALGGLMSW